MDIIMVSVETVGDFYIKADDRLQQSIKRGDVLGTTFHSILRSASLGGLLSLEILRDLRNGDGGLALRKAGGALILPPIMLFVAGVDILTAYSLGAGREIKPTKQ